ncbi:Protein of uncharacterised function (DUF2867) [Jonesia denitrificans]|nr:Protein of uncharacterised function (DUF2867) [Jonesia denitrificans]
MVIGSGSASFEMVRHLTEVLPVMPAPQWVLNHIQPIAVHDVLYYLLGASPRFPCSPHVSHRIGSTSSRPCPGKSPADPLPSDPNWAGRAVYTDERTAHSTAPVTDLWHVVITIGGDNGWYSTPILWAIRGWIDKLVGGVGLARGRRSSTTVHVGDAIDFWRVEAVTEGTLLRLRAEMKVPGHAWLEMRCEPHDTGSTYTQRAVFFPRGLAGRMYWWAVYPFHGLVFSGMQNRIVALAEQRAARPQQAM